MFNILRFVIGSPHDLLLWCSSGQCPWSFVYVNAIPPLVKYGRLLQFADDTTLICLGAAHDEVQCRLEYNLGLLFSWINSSKMKLNIAKPSLMWFKSK